MIRLQVFESGIEDDCKEPGKPGFFVSSSLLIACKKSADKFISWNKKECH